MTGIKDLDQDSSLGNRKDVKSPWRQNQDNLITQLSRPGRAWRKPGRPDGQAEKQTSLILAAGKMQMETSDQEYEMMESRMVGKGKL